MQLSAWEWAVAEAARARDATIGDSRRRERGVVHTSVGLAHAAMRRLDAALVRALGLRAGLSDPRVVVIDPGCGPGVFLAAALSVIAGRASRPRALVGFEVDEDAARTARASLGAVALGAGIRLEARLGNALAAEPDEVLAPFGDDAVIVVVGNPPWAGRSANREAAVTEALLEDFRRDAEGVRLRERKIGVLSDDYVRFVRWSCELVRRARGGGALALFTNGSFLDGPVHRGMRRALRAWLDALEVVDFGGSSLVARDGAQDDNVFGVRPTVAWTLGTRRAGRAEGSLGDVRYARLRGTRDEKTRAFALDVAPERIALGDGYAAFKPTSAGDRFPSEWIALDALFPFHREGIQTNRDDVAVAHDAASLVERLGAFARGERRADLDAAYRARAHYDVEDARARVRRALDAWGGRGRPSFIVPVAYRPFDERVVAAIPGFCHRPRPALQDAVARSASCLLTVAKDRGERPWSHVAVSRAIPDNCFFSSRSSCRTRAFPTHRADGSENLDRAAIPASVPAAVRVATVESWMAYALGVLGSAAYQARFDAALRRGFAAVPAPRDASEFAGVARAGERLRDVWLRAPVVAGGPIPIGHRSVRAEGLPEALQQCDAAVGSLLGTAGLD